MRYHSNCRFLRGHDSRRATRATACPVDQRQFRQCSKRSSDNRLNGGQVIVDYLIREKVPYAFGLCGHGNIQFIDALYERQNDIKTISVHHESVCGFMADVYYRVSGQPVATFTSCGPGSVNLPIALATAYLDSVPFLAVTGNVPTSQFDRGAFQEMYRQYQADFPVHRAQHVQAGVPADPRRAGADDGAAGVEDHGHRTARPGRARRAVRRVRGGRRRRDAEAARNGAPTSRRAAAPIRTAW